MQVPGSRILKEENIMSLRSLERSIARERMKRAGVERINKKRIWDNNAGKKHEGGWRSYFAMNWRKYLDPTSSEYKMAMGGKTRKKKGFLQKVRVRV